MRAREHQTTADGVDATLIVLDGPARVTIPRGVAVSRRRLFAGLAALTISSVVAVTGDTVAQARSQRFVVRSCGTVAFVPDSTDGAFHIIARGTSCRVARAVAGHSSPERYASGNRSYRALGFRCRGRGGDISPAQPSLYVVRYRCTKGSRVVRFLRS
jgi:hypothetical protein